MYLCHKKVINRRGSAPRYAVRRDRKSENIASGRGRKFSAFGTHANVLFEGEAAGDWYSREIAAKSVEDVEVFHVSGGEILAN